MLRKDIISRVQKFYDERNASYRETLRKSLVKASENEEIETIRKRINEIKAMSLTGAATEETDKEYATLEERFRSLVKGYLPTVNYECKKCKDTGKIGGKYCNCFLNRYSSELKKLSNLSSNATFRFEESDIASLPIDEQSKTKLSKLYAFFEDFANKYPNVKTQNVMISGTSGTGKTCLVSAIASRLLERNISVLYITAFELSEILIKIHLGAPIDYMSLLKDADALIIDDLGTEPIRNNVNLKYMQAIVDFRIANKKTMMMTTNLTAEAMMEQYGERLTSRLLAKNVTKSIDMPKIENIRLKK